VAWSAAARVRRGCLVNQRREPCGRRPPTTTYSISTRFCTLAQCLTTQRMSWATGLTMAEKRAILASWASDASAIASCPSMRSSAGLKRPVSIDEILEALCELDGGPRNPPGGKPYRLRSTERAIAA
jgi:hypothetical protein